MNGTKSAVQSLSQHEQPNTTTAQCARFRKMFKTIFCAVCTGPYSTKCYGPKQLKPRDRIARLSRTLGVIVHKQIVQQPTLLANHMACEVTFLLDFVGCTCFRVNMAHGEWHTNA